MYPKQETGKTSCGRMFRHGRAVSFLLLCGILIQACAVVKTETKVIPGKELSRTSQGFREVESTYSLTEKSPFSVVVMRHVCEAEAFRVEYKGQDEITHERRELHCLSAYPGYIALQVTTLGIPFLYDLATGFNIFKNMCDTGSPQYTKNYQESSSTVTKEITDSGTTRCKDAPVAEARVEALFDGKLYPLVSSADGVATLGSEQVTAVRIAGSDVAVDYRYRNLSTKTTYKQPVRTVSQKTVKTDGKDAASTENSKGSAAATEIDKKKGRKSDTDK